MMHHQQVFHPFQTCPAHRNLSVVWTGNPSRKPWIDRAIPGDDSHLERCASEPVRQTAGASAEFQPSGASQEPMNNAMMKPVGQFAPLIGRRQHHYASQIFQLMFMQVLTQHNAAQGMGYKMDF